MVLKVTRRDVIKVGATVGVLTAASSLFVGRMSTIRAVGASKPDSQPSSLDRDGRKHISSANAGDQPDL